MSQLSVFARFSKASDKLQHDLNLKNAVVYTRVSTKEQFDKNMSLDTQRQIIIDYASRNGYTILETFGGTYESAKTDGRKEFNRMLEYVKRRKGKVTHILVYMLDRFSRTGGGAIQLAEDLREDYGVDIVAVTQPADTSNAGGRLQQSIQFMFAKHDNDIRKQRAVTGIKEKLKRGGWAAKVPFGYDSIIINGEKRIVVNETGRKLKKAFEWKCEGMKNEEIIEKLKALDVSVYKQQLSRIFQNPFYCGLMVHKSLDGEIVKGTHEKLVSQELFLLVNDIHEQTPGYGIPHKKTQKEVPLKVFIRCLHCQQPFTGYVVKRKNLWYYKCRTNGCRCNKRAAHMHDLFLELISQYTFRSEANEPLRHLMELLWRERNKDLFDMEATFKSQLTELERKIQNTEENYFVTKEMSRQLYEKFMDKFRKEQEQVREQIAELENRTYHFGKPINQALQSLADISRIWTILDPDKKERFQRLVFPDGVLYNKDTNIMTAPKVNTMFRRK